MGGDAMLEGVRTTVGNGYFYAIFIDDDLISSD